MAAPLSCGNMGTLQSLESRSGTMTATLAYTDNLKPWDTVGRLCFIKTEYNLYDLAEQNEYEPKLDPCFLVFFFCGVVLVEIFSASARCAWYVNI